MTAGMEQFVKSWLFDPTMGQLTSATVGILIVIVLMRISRGVLNRYSREPGNFYRAKKMVTFLGYFTGLVIISLIFSDRLGKIVWRIYDAEEEFQLHQEEHQKVRENIQARFPNLIVETFYIDTNGVIKTS